MQESFFTTITSILYSILQGKWKVETFFHVPPLFDDNPEKSVMCFIRNLSRRGFPWRLIAALTGNPPDTANKRDTNEQVRHPPPSPLQTDPARNMRNEEDAKIDDERPREKGITVLFTSIESRPQHLGQRPLKPVSRP